MTDEERKIYYYIDPRILDIYSLYNYLIHNISFDKVLSLYILLRNDISTGNIGDEDNEKKKKEIKEKTSSNN